MNDKQKARVLIHIQRIHAEEDMIRQIVGNDEADLILHAMTEGGALCPKCLGGCYAGSDKIGNRRDGYVCPSCKGLGYFDDQTPP